MPNADMKTLTIGDTTYEIVDEEAREREGDLSDLETQVKTDLVAAINEVANNSGVVSVNGKTGVVVLAASDVGAATTGALTDEATARTAADAQLQSQITALGNGAPIPVSAIAAMTVQTQVYLYTGSETGESTGYWYSYDSTQEKFVPRGEYGGAVTDTTLSISGRAADAKAVGEALAEKADSADVTALDTRITAVDGDVDDIKSTLTQLESDVSTLDEKSFAETFIGEQTTEITTTHITEGTRILTCKINSGETYKIKVSDLDSIITPTETYHKINVKRVNQDSTLTSLGQLDVDKEYTFVAEADIYGFTAYKSAGEVVPPGDLVTTCYRINGSNTLESRISSVKDDTDWTSNDLESYEKKANVHYKTEWVNGGLANDGTIYPAYVYRISTKDVQHNTNNIIIKSIDDSFLVILKLFTDSTATSVYKSVNISPSNCPYLIPNGSYFRLTIRRSTENTSEVANVYDFYSKVTIEAFTDRILDNITPLTDAYFFGRHTEHYIRNDGLIISNSNYALSDWIKVKAGDVIKYKLKAATTVYLIALCSEKVYNADTLISGVLGIGDGVSDAYYVDGEYTVISDCYFRYCYNKTTGTNGYCYVKNAIQTESAIRLNALEDTVNQPIPSYWESAIASAESRYKTLSKEMSSNVVAFPFITDVHWGSNAKKSPRLIKRICDDLGLEHVIVGGDIETGHETTADACTEITDDFLRRLPGNVVTTIGNHDNNSDQNTDATKIVADGVLYNSFFRRWEQEITSDGIHQSYYDIPSHKIRFVSIDTGTVAWYKGAGDTTYNYQILEDACDWASAKIAELPSGWSVIIVTHIIWSGAVAGSTPSILTSYVDRIRTKILDVTYSAEIIAILAGHLHRDISTTLKSTDEQSSFLTIGVTTDNYLMSEQWGGPEMTKGTATEQAFDLFQIDLDNRDIYATRIGAGDNRHWTY